MVRKKKDAAWKGYLRSFFLLLALSLTASLIFRIAELLEHSSFDGVSRFSVAIYTSQDIAIFSIEPKTKRAEVLEISGNILTDDPSENAGSYQIGKTYKLGSLDGKGGKLFSQSAEFLMGIPVDGFFVVKTETSHFCERSDYLFTLSCSFYLLTESLRGNVDTNITSIDIARILFAGQIEGSGRGDKLSLLDEVEYIEEELADGAKVVRIRESSLDTVSKDLLSDSAIFNEALGVSLVNGTEVSGYGSRLARILTNAGAHIVSVSTPKEKVEQSMIEYKSGVGDSYTLKRLKRHLGFPKKPNDQLIHEDIRISLGADIW